jgi:hypothetical protein
VSAAVFEEEDLLITLPDSADRRIAITDPEAVR